MFHCRHCFTSTTLSMLRVQPSILSLCKSLQTSLHVLYFPCQLNAFWNVFFCWGLQFFVSSDPLSSSLPFFSLQSHLTPVLNLQFSPDPLWHDPPIWTSVSLPRLVTTLLLFPLSFLYAFLRYAQSISFHVLSYIQLHLHIRLTDLFLH